MSLSEAFNPNKPPNIKNVTWTPEKKVVSNKPFDPERDITEEDFKNANEQLGVYRASGSWYEFVGLASELLVLSPERRKLLGLIESDFENAKKQLDKERAAYLGWDSALYIAVCLLVIFPERKNMIDISKEDFIRTKKQIAEYVAAKDWYFFSKLSFDILAFYPECRELLDSLKAKIDFGGVKEKIDKYRRRGDWRKFSGLAAYFCVLYPDKRDSLGLTEKDMLNLVEEFEEYKVVNDIRPRSYIAHNLQILFADEIMRGNDGRLHITFNKPKPTELKEETPPMPTTRNY